VCSWFQFLQEIVLCSSSEHTNPSKYYIKWVQNFCMKKVYYLIYWSK
jgi:hypothetical protein